ncbi:MAG: substrate-binding domain-containing protein, partial [Actinobacteria bacterium]|nr:substrate-binding domain-containing protein [Actinomycetota bacterium]
GDLGTASIKVDNAYVAPTADAAAKAADVSKRVPGRAGNDMALQIVRTTTESGAYPLVLVSYAIACPAYKDTKTADLVKGYLSYVVGSDGQTAAAKTAGSAALSRSLSGDATDAVKQIAAK